MATYLLTWNPEKWDWSEPSLDEEISKLKIQGHLTDRWSCGNTRKIVHGDRLFILRQGRKPRGIFASGWAASPCYQDYHWDGSDRPALYIDIDFDVLINPEKEPILERLRLNDGNLSEMHWDTQMSGISIPNEIAFNLEVVWANFLSNNNIRQLSGAFDSALFPNEILESDVYYIEGTPKQITTNRYERNPHARAECLQQWGLSCSVCSFNFATTYGDIGKDFIHVHHLRSLSEISDNYVVNPKDDLRPVCPNCHAMIHKRNPAYTIEEIKTLLRETGSI
jgi:5-methylcytosine-specific restriction enzyme A